MMQETIYTPADLHCGECEWCGEKSIIRIMKKKYRRAIYFTLIGIIALIFSPIFLIGVIIACMYKEWFLPMKSWLKTKLKVYDIDPD